jgi:hypothetical protein
MKMFYKVSIMKRTIAFSKSNLMKKELAKVGNRLSKPMTSDLSSKK